MIIAIIIIINNIDNISINIIDFIIDFIQSQNFTKRFDQSDQKFISME